MYTLVLNCSRYLAICITCLYIYIFNNQRKIFIKHQIRNEGKGKQVVKNFCGIMNMTASLIRSHWKYTGNFTLTLETRSRNYDQIHIFEMWAFLTNYNNHNLKAICRNEYQDCLYTLPSHTY